MNTNQTAGLEASSALRPKTEGERLEGIAFTFCKAATIILIAQRFALPVAAGFASIFYAWAYVKGKHDTRCILRLPILIAGFWAAIAAISLFAIFAPGPWHRLMPWF